MERKSREEHRSYLEYSTGEYKESKTVLTKPFGDVEEKATLFLDALNKKYITITEINFKEFMQEAQTFCDNYEYKKVNLVKTKEELLAERADNKKKD